jgi:hypothetical protein
MMQLDYPQKGLAIDSILHQFTTDTNIVKFTTALDSIKTIAKKQGMTGHWFR